MKTIIPIFAILFFSSLSFATKDARDALIQKKFSSTRKDMKKCLEYPNRQVYPSFTVKFAIQDEKARDISFPGSGLKETEVSCLSGVIKKIDFNGVAPVQVQQTVSFRSQSGSD